MSTAATGLDRMEPPKPVPYAGAQLRNWTDQILSAVSLLIVLILVGLPLGALLYGSFRTASPTVAEGSFTLRQWIAVYTTPDFVQPLLNTFIIALPVTLASLVVGAGFAWIVARTDTPGKVWLETLLLAPFFLSPFVGAMAWVSLAAPRTGLLNVFVLGDGRLNVFSPIGVIWVMFLYYAPYAYLFTAGAVRAMDPSLEEAARMLRSSTWTILRRVTLPLILPALAAAGILIFILSAEMFSIPGLIGRPANFTNLPYRIYYATRTTPPEWPLAAAAGTVLLWLAVIGVYLNRYLSRQSRRFATITGKGYRPRLYRLGPWRWVTFGSILLYVFLAVVLPYAALTLSSFMKFASTDIKQSLFTMENYKFLGDPVFRRALVNTTLLGVLSPTAIVLLALIMSYLINRTKTRGRQALDVLGTLPAAIPGIVLGIGMLWAYFKVPLPIFGTLWILVLAYVAKNLPQGLRVLNATIIQIHQELEESSRMCRANGLQTLARITFPLLRPSLAYVWILTFIVTVRELSAAVVLYSANSMVIPVLLWDQMESGNMQAGYATAVVQTLMILAVIVAARYVFRLKFLE